MKDIKFVNAEDLSNLEEYATSLLTGMISLRTLDSYHAAAYKKGLLKEDEVKNCEAINFAINSLLKIYRAQMENILYRLEISEEDIIAEFKKMMPNVKIPRKKKVKDNAKASSKIPNI